MSSILITFLVAMAAGVYVGRLERRVKKAEPIETLWGKVE